MIDIAVHKTWQNADTDFQLNCELGLNDREFLCIYGSSGAGKTSLLRILAGLTVPDRGHISVDENSWFDSVSGHFTPTQKREIGYVFQEYTLFPNMTVKQNLLFATGDKVIGEFLRELIEVSELKPLLERMPTTLSGGQQQRVALVRALARKPKLLLLDEPLSALDTSIRRSLQDLLLSVHKRFDITVVMVTHDIAEVFRLASKVLKMENGQVKAIGQAKDIFSNSRVSGKFQFTGEIVAIEAQDVIQIVSVLIGMDVVKVIATKLEAQAFQIGDKVLVASKAFNPMIQKIS
jgi:molybdate transport system ATP-binding protein